MKCSICHIDYPDELVQPMETGVVGGITPVRLSACGICALEHSVQVSGVKRDTFTPGSMAEALRSGAALYRQSAAGQTQMAALGKAAKSGKVT